LATRATGWASRPASIMMYDDPALMHEIMEHLTDFMIELIYAGAGRDRDIDYGIFWEDMCYKTASIISPKHFREFMVPRYKRITDVMRKYGVDIILVDSDGHVDELVPLWLEADYPASIRSRWLQGRMSSRCESSTPTCTSGRHR